MDCLTGKKYSKDYGENNVQTDNIPDKKNPRLIFQMILRMIFKVMIMMIITVIMIIII